MPTVPALTRDELKAGAVWAKAQAMPERRAATTAAACMVLLLRPFPIEMKPKARPDIPVLPGPPHMAFVVPFQPLVAVDSYRAGTDTKEGHRMPPFRWVNRLRLRNNTQEELENTHKVIWAIFIFLAGAEFLMVPRDS